MARRSTAKAQPCTTASARTAIEVQRGNLYIYSIRRNGERVATVALGRHNGRAYLEQIRGPCNTEPPKAIVATVERWLHAQRPLPPCKAIEATLGTDLKEVAA